MQLCIVYDDGECGRRKAIAFVWTAFVFFDQSGVLVVSEVETRCCSSEHPLKVFHAVICAEMSTARWLSANELQVNARVNSRVNQELIVN